MTNLENTNFVSTPYQRKPVVSLWILERGLTSLIRRGTLHLNLPDGITRRFGEGAPVVSATIHDWRTLRRIALNADLALGEAWTDGTLTVEQGDIYGLLDLCMSNVGLGSGYWLRRLQIRMRRLIRPLLMHNPMGKAQRNVAHHYDLSDALYDLFLDPERQYSCAYFATPEDTLEEAQLNKMRHIANKLRLKSGQKLLDIGSGWGGLGLFMARKAGVDVTGVTLSVEQQNTPRHAPNAKACHNKHALCCATTAKLTTSLTESYQWVCSSMLVRGIILNISTRSQGCLNKTVLR